MSEARVVHEQRLNLIVRRIIPASAERLFDAWTQPELLTQWWGPENVECPDAEVDLKVGGNYRIANQMDDGNLLWIYGQFETIERPHKLVYTWCIADERSNNKKNNSEASSETSNETVHSDGLEHSESKAKAERVTVHFKPLVQSTEVIVIHEQIATNAIKESHTIGWNGCLDGLANFTKAVIKKQ
ncbi:SRPBCC family protein [Aliikangiella coralliicola]|nr:SRPBCC domain-containing protein [Aliikangiella coralliicola]